MKTILLMIFTMCCVLMTGCDKKPSNVTMVQTLVKYSHPKQDSGGFEMTRRQEVGTITKKTPSSGQPMSLTENKVVLFSMSTDASDPNKILVTVESVMDGFPPEAKTLEFGSSAPHPPAAQFKNGLTAAVSVSTYSK